MWPAAVLVPIVIASRKRIQVLASGVAVTAVVGLGTYLSGGLPHIMDFLTNQGERGMQLEATFSTPWVWLSVFNIAGSKMADNTAINSTEVYGPGASVAAFLMQPLLIVAAVVAAILLVRALKRGAEREELFLEGALMMTTAFIVFNKVGSPQFIIWLAPVIIAGPDPRLGALEGSGCPADGDRHDHVRDLPAVLHAAHPRPPGHGRHPHHPQRAPGGAAVVVGEADRGARTEDDGGSAGVCSHGRPKP